MPDSVRGLIWAAASIGASIPLEGTQVFELFVALLGVAVGISVGDALRNPDSQHTRLVVASGFAFIVLGLFGLWESPVYLISAWALHGIWDVFRHQQYAREGELDAGPGAISEPVVSGGDEWESSGRSPGSGKLARWYPSAFLVYDLLVAAYLLVHWQLIS